MVVLGCQYYIFNVAIVKGFVSEMILYGNSELLWKRQEVELGHTVGSSTMSDVE
jgi:hypothetical protein